LELTKARVLGSALQISKKLVILKVNQCEKKKGRYN